MSREEEKDQNAGAKKADPASSDKDRDSYVVPNTRPVPIIITLAAAGISCLTSIFQEVSFGTFVFRLLITVIVFGVIGSFVRVFLDMGFKTDKKEEESEDDTSGTESADEAGEESGSQESPSDSSDTQE